MSTNKRNRAVRLLGRILFGALFSSALFFQNAGFVSSAFADETKNANADATAGIVLSTADSATGLTGPDGGKTVSTSGEIKIINGATAFVAVLDEESASSTDVLGGVSLTLNENGSIMIGDMESTTDLGDLSVAGFGANDPSTLTAKNGSTITIGTSGLLEIGGDSGSGSLVLENGSKLLNAGTSSSGLDRGVVVDKNGTLTVGSASAKTTGTIIDGDGAFQNNGVVSVFNESGYDNRAHFGAYSDSADAKLTATGAVRMEGGDGKNGEITISGGLDAAEWSTKSDAILAGTSVVNIAGLATLGNAEVGASLTVESANAKESNVFLGGLKAFSVLGSDSKRTGGQLVLESGAQAQITGLDVKMNAAGELDAENGLYDVWLGSNFTLDGTLISSKKDSKPENEEDKFKTEALGIRWNGASKISATGALYADDLTVSVAGESTLENSGALIVQGKMSVSLEGSDATFKLTNLANKSKGAWIEEWTLGEGQTFVNGKAKDTTTSAKEIAIDINKLTLSGGNVQALGASTTRVAELTIDADSQDGKKVALQTGDDAVVTVKKFDLIRGIAKLESTKNAAGLNSHNADTVYTIGKADQVATDDAQLQIMGTDATFGLGTLKLEGQGLLVQESGKTLTFSGTQVVNASQRTGTAAYSLSSDKLVFGTGSSYSGGKTIRTQNATFQSGSTLNLGVDSPLTIANGGSLTLEKGATLNVEFDASGNGVGKVVLNGSGTATLAEGSAIKASNISALGVGTYSGVAIETETAKNVFNATAEQTAFYTLKATASDDGKDLNLELTVAGDSTQFAQSANELAVAEYVDAVRAAENVSDELRAALDEYVALGTGTEVAAALNSLGGVQRANSLTLAMNSPWRQAFAHTSLPERRAYSDGYLQQYSNNGVYRGQISNAAVGGDVYVDESAYAAAGYNGYNGGFGPATPRSVWYAQTYRGLDGQADGNSAAFDVSDVGMQIGYEAVRATGFVGGVAFGYSQPRLTSDEARTTASNFQLGLYGGGTTANGWETKIYVGGGLQNYTSKRFATVGETENFHRSTFDGQSFAAAIQFGRPITLDALSLWRPVVQFDVEQVWQDGATESGAGTALQFEKADWNRAFARVGLEYEFNGPFCLFNARTIYGIQLGGDSAPESEFKFAGFDGAQTATVSGVDQGDSFFDVGIGANGYLDCERRWTIGGAYDFVSSDKTSSHVGTVSLSYLF